MDIMNPTFKGNISPSGVPMEVKSRNIVYGFIADPAEGSIPYGAIVSKGSADNLVRKGLANADSDIYGVAIYSDSISANRPALSNCYMAGMPIDVLLDGYLWYYMESLEGVGRASKVYANKATGEIYIGDDTLSDSWVEVSWIAVSLVDEKKERVLLRIDDNRTGDSVPIHSTDYNSKIDLSLINTTLAGGYACDSLCKAITEVDISSGITRLNNNSVYMLFADMGSLKTIKGLDSFNAQTYTNCISLFQNCYSLEEIDVSFTLTGQHLTSMFAYCVSLAGVDLTGFDISNVLDFSSMFAHCLSLTSVSWGDYSNSVVESIDNMFYNCPAMTEIDLSWISDSSHMANNVSIAFADQYTRLESVTTLVLGNNWASNDNVSLLAFDNMPNLSAESLTDIASKLATRTNSPTIRFYSDVEGKATWESTKSAMEAKGWEVLAI